MPIPFRVALRLLVLFLAAFSAGAVRGAPDEPPDYELADDALKIVKLDSADTASFLAVRADASGRLFVGGREELYVYEPDDKTVFKPRQLLYTFPKDAWINDIEIRGHDLYVMTV